MSAPVVDQEYDAVVIGGGIAGCVATMCLRRRAPDARVLLLEGGNFPRHKVCGEFFSPEGWNVLRRLGLTAELTARGAHPVPQARVLTSHAQTGAIALPAPAWAISRWTLDDLLWRHAAAVSAAHTDCHVRGVTRDAGGFLVQTRDAAFRARFIIEANGRRALHHEDGTPETHHTTARTAPGGRFAGIKTHFVNAPFPRDEVQLFPFRGGYCGLVKVEEERVNACLLAHYDAFGNAEAAWRRALSENTALERALRGARPVMPWLATANVGFGKMEPVSNGILRCGDAAGFIQPFTGDGQALAARSGELAAVCIGAALRGELTEAAAAGLYAAAWQREFAARLRWGRRLQPLLLAPRAGDIAVWTLRQLPGLARLAARRTRSR